MTDVGLKKRGVYLGRVGETGRYRVWMDVSEWEDEYSGGTGLFLLTNPEGTVLPMSTSVVTDEDGTRMYGLVTDTETAIAGVCVIEASWTSGGVLAKSEHYNGLVLEATYTGETTPDSTPTWVRDLITELNAAGVLLQDAADLAGRVDEIEEAMGEAGNGQVAVADGEGNFVWSDHNVSVFDASSTYDVNDFVLYGGVTYRCIHAITAAKAWDADDWTRTYVADDLGNVLTWIESMDSRLFLKNENLLDYTTPEWGTSTYYTVEKVDGGYHITSTGQAERWITFFNDNDSLPGIIVPGKTYKLQFETEVEELSFRVYVYLDGDTSTTSRIVMAQQDMIFTIPENTTGIMLRVQWTAGNTFDTVVYPRLSMLETAGEVIHNYDYDGVTIPEDVVQWQDFAVVGNEIWMIASSGDDHSTQDGVIYRLNKSDFSYIGSMTHNLGHANAISYDAENDALLVTNGTYGGTYLTIFKDVSQWTGPVDFETVDKVTITLSGLDYTTRYMAAVWGEKKRDGYRYIYIGCNLGANWLKIEPGAENGSYTSDYTVIWEIPCAVGAISGVNSSQVFQGMEYHKGKIYASIAHNPIYGAVYTVSSNNHEMIREIIHVDGTGLQNVNEGCGFIDGVLHLGVSADRILTRVDL